MDASAWFDKRIRWVTLTMPNFDCPIEGLTQMKKIYRNFRHRKKFQSKVVGTADFWEWTKNESDGSFNVHYHGFWVGDYWEQSDLLEEWAVGGARIEGVRGYRKRLNYLISYAKKQHELGIRCQQLTGCLFGSAHAVLKSQLTLLLESAAADDAQE